MHRSRLASLWIDVPAEVFEPTWRFWGAVLDMAPRSVGSYPDTYVELGTFDRLPLGIQRLDDGRLRWHLDVGSDEVTPADAADRWLRVGATAVATHDDWMVLRDPAGLAFCTVSGSHHLWLDVPTSDLQAASAFWSAALGAEARPEPGNEDTYFLLGSTGERVTLGVQRLDEGDARWHVDIETDDRDAEVARLEALGARRVAQIETWWVMQDPVGQVFCVVNVQTEGFADARSWP